MSRPADIVFSAQALDVIRTHLEKTYPLEGCGALIARCGPSNGMQIVRAVPIRNAEPVRGEDRFSLDGREFLRLERELEAAGKRERIAGFFHSHPDAPAVPSALDLDCAVNAFEIFQIRYLYVIQEVRGGRAASLRCWVLEGSTFAELSWIQRE